MTQKHTPGPWKVGPPHMDNNEIVVRDADDWIIAYCHDHDTDLSRDIELANAHLIAQAPMLLEACYEALNALNTFETISGFNQKTSATMTLEEAIAKATES